MGRIPVRGLVQIPDLELVVMFLMTYLGIRLPPDPKGKVPSIHNPMSAEPAIPKLIQQLDLFITWSMSSSLLSIISPLVALVVTSKPPETAPIAQAIPVMALSLFVSLVDSEMDDLNTLQLFNDRYLHCFQNCSIYNWVHENIYEGNE